MFGAFVFMYIFFFFCPKTINSIASDSDISDGFFFLSPLSTSSSKIHNLDKKIFKVIKTKERCFII